MEKIEHRMSFTSQDIRHMDRSDSIFGWGADLEPTSRPAVPKDAAPDVGIETLYPCIQPQQSNVEILVSTEHAQRPPVFGTPCPPKGLSGIIRRFAFRFSEGELTHWFALIAADRVDVVEDLLNDLAHLRVPNLYKEMGLAAEWKYNRKAFVRKAAIAGVGLGALALYLNSRRTKTVH